MNVLEFSVLHCLRNWRENFWAFRSKKKYQLKLKQQRNLKICNEQIKKIINFQWTNQENQFTMIQPRNLQIYHEPSNHNRNHSSNHNKQQRDPQK